MLPISYVLEISFSCIFREGSSCVHAQRFALQKQVERDFWQ